MTTIVNRPVVTVDALLMAVQRLEDAADNELFPTCAVFRTHVGKMFRAAYRMLPKEAASVLAEVLAVLLNQLLDSSVESFFGAADEGARWHSVLSQRQRGCACEWCVAGDGAACSRWSPAFVAVQVSRRRRSCSTRCRAWTTARSSCRRRCASSARWTVPRT